MGLSPLEIRKKDFSRKMMGGVEPSEVRIFLELIAEELEKHLSEKSAMKTELDVVKERLTGYMKQEEMIQRTLILAEKTSEEAITNARKQAELTIEDAKNKGREIENAYAHLKSAKRQFVLEFETLLETFRRHVREFGGKEDEEEAADQGLVG